MDIKETFGWFYDQSKVGIYAAAALLCSVLVYFKSLLTNFQNLHVHPHSMMELAGRYNLGWKDYDLFHHMFFAYNRPRFLSYFMFKVDLVIRETLNYYFIPHPTLSVALLLTGIIAPILLYKGLVNYGLRKGAALACVAVFLTHIGFQSSLTVFYQQGKFITVSILIIAFYLGTLLNRTSEKHDLQTFWSLRGRWPVWALFLISYVGLLFDEYGLFTIILFPAMFPNLFFDKEAPFRWPSIKRALVNLTFLALPLIVFVAFYLVVLPTFSETWFGVPYHFFAGMKADIGSTQKNSFDLIFNIVASLYRNIPANIFSLFGTTFIPHSEQVFGPGVEGNFWMVFAPQLTFFNIAFVTGLLSLIFYIAWTSKAQGRWMLRAWFGLTAVFLGYHTLLHSFHIPQTSGYYYGCNFSFIVAFLVAALFKLTEGMSFRVRMVPALLVVYLVINQSLNFQVINDRQIMTHNQWGGLRMKANKILNIDEPLLGPNAKSFYLDKEKLLRIWKEWQAGHLDEYVKNNKIDAINGYMALELKRLPPPSQSR